MPIAYKLRPICEMVELGLARLHGFDFENPKPFNKPGTNGPDPLSILYKTEIQMNASADAGMGDKKTRAQELQMDGFNLTDAQENFKMSRDQIWNTVNFCRQLTTESLEYCKYAKERDDSIKCEKADGRKFSYSPPECWSDADCPAIDSIERKCITNLCRLNYERIVDLVVMGGDETGGTKNYKDLKCSDIPQGWPEPNSVDVDKWEDVVTHDNGELGQKNVLCGSKLCMKKSKDYLKEGICMVYLVTDQTCESQGFSKEIRAFNGNGDLNFNSQNVRLCIDTDSCEQTKGAGKCKKGFIGNKLRESGGQDIPCDKNVTADRWGYCDCEDGNIDFVSDDRISPFACKDVCKTGRRKAALTKLDVVTHNPTCKDDMKRAPFDATNNADGSLHVGSGGNLWCPPAYLCQSPLKPTV